MTVLYYQDKNKTILSYSYSLDISFICFLFLDTTNNIITCLSRLPAKILLFSTETKKKALHFSDYERTKTKTSKNL